MQTVLLTHGDSIDKIGDNFRPIGKYKFGYIGNIYWIFWKGLDI